MIKKFGAYGVGLIALYIGVNSASNAGSLISAGAQGISTITKTFQGRG